MADFTVGNHTYKSRKLDAFTQLHIARRISPLLGSLGDAYKKFLASGKDPLVVLEPVSQAVSQLKDADVNYVMNHCLSVCQRRQADAVWANVASINGGLQFEDIELPEMLLICWHVLEENLGRFMAALPSELKDKLTATQAESAS